MARSDARVVVTGLGVVTPLARDVPGFWAGLCAGRSGIGRWLDPDPRVACTVGGDLSDFSFDDWAATEGRGLPADLTKAARRALRATPVAGRLTAAAALQAADDAGLRDAGHDPGRVGHVLGGHNLNAGYGLRNARTFLLGDPEFVDPLYGFLGLDTDVLAVISALLDVRGPALSAGAACASGNVALLAALQLLRSGACDAVLVTGAAMEVDPLWLQAWVILDAVCHRDFQDEPHRASRPFDRRRQGFVPSMGAGAVVLETLASAERRGQAVHAELLGAASTSAATRSTRPGLDAQVRVMSLALADAGLAPDDVDTVNAHATSTPLGDAVEVAAIKELLGARAAAVPVNATKSMVGHCLTAAGIVELVAVVQQLATQTLHPTTNLDEPDPELDLDFVPGQARPHAMDVALSNAFGFGGLNASVVVGRAPR